MIEFLLVVVLLAGLVASAYLLGFRLGGDRWRDEVARVRAESIHAERQLRDLTRQAFVAMAEHAERRRRP